MFAVKMPSGSLIPKTFAELADVKKEANGFLLSRSREKKVEVVQVIPGAPDFAWPVIWRATRKSPGGPITWVAVDPD